jgi:hypothetical protein
MIAAILFNSDDPKFGGYYGPPIRDLIFGAGTLQRANRHMKIKYGDVLIYSHARNRKEYERLAEATYFGVPWSLVDAERIRSSYMKETLWAWVVQNITRPVAEERHDRLRGDSAYIGLHAVDFALPQHLMLYRNAMPEYCRVFGDQATLFYSMGNEDDKDEHEPQELLRLGFRDVEWEDRGAHGSIFDRYDDLEHFQQVREIQTILARGTEEGDYAAEELVMMLQDLHPRLFYSLGAAVRAMNRARNEEDVAQVGLSCRRYIEQLADVLYPARPDRPNGRDVSQSKFRNRIWAYVSEAVPATETSRDQRVGVLGKEVDRMIDEVNSMLHGSAGKELALNTLWDLARLSSSLLTIDVRAVRKPYEAFNESIEDMLGGDDSDDV